MMFLRQSTTSTIHVGPMLASDGITLQTAIALAAGTCDLFRSNGTSSADISGHAWSHIAAGVYGLVLAPGDLDTLGPLQVHVHPASVRPVLVQANVLSQAAYDAMCGGGRFQADVQAIAGNSTAAGLLALGAASTQRFTVQNGASATTVPTDFSQAVSGFFTGRTVVMTSGALAGQAVQISAYNGATKVLTVSQLTSAPAAGDQGLIV